MISDVLSEASQRIQSYLDEPTYDRMYSGAMRERIERLLGTMSEIQKELDRSPEKIKPISPRMRFASPADGIVHEQLNCALTEQDEQMLRLVKSTTAVYSNFIQDCLDAKEDRYITKDHEKQAIEQQAKWVRSHTDLVRLLGVTQ